MKLLARPLVGLLVMALISPVLFITSEVGPLMVASIGDSQLGNARSYVTAVQDNRIHTEILASNGCGLMVDGDKNNPKGKRWCMDDRNNSQPIVNAYWQKKIADVVVKLQPSYFQIELGLNDAGWHDVDELTKPVTGFKALLEQFMRWLPPGVPVLWDNLPDMNPALAPRFQVVNDALYAVAAENPNLHIVDLRSTFAGHWPEWYDPVFAAHYNDTGQYEFARVNCEALVALAGATIHTNCDPKGTRASTNSTSPPPKV